MKRLPRRWDDSEKIDWRLVIAFCAMVVAILAFSANLMISIYAVFWRTE